jgi:hypothetical protein
MSYTYLVENATTLINITEAARNVTVDGLRENSRYHYQVLVSNQFGSSSPSTAVEVGQSLQRTSLPLFKDLKGPIALPSSCLFSPSM